MSDKDVFTYLLREIPVQEYREFKGLCAVNGTTVRKEIIKFITDTNEKERKKWEKKH